MIGVGVSICTVAATSTGGGGVAVEPPILVDTLDTDVQAIYELEGVSSFRTPPAREGDTIVIFLERGNTTTLLQADCDLGTLRHANTNRDTHVNGVWTHKVTAATKGLEVTLSGGMNGLVLNAGARDFDVADGSTGEGSGASPFDVVTTTADDALVLRYASRRNSGTIVHSMPTAEAEFPAAEFAVRGGTPASEVRSLFSEVQTTAGDCSAETVQFPSYGRHSKITLALTPATLGASIYATEQYAANANAEGEARTTTTSTVVFGFTGITATLDDSYQVGTFANGLNDGIGDLFVYAPSGCTVNSYTPAYTTTGREQNGAMLNPRAIPPNVTLTQGFDGISGNGPSFADGKRAAAPISMSPGDKLVISTSDADGVESYAILTCVSTIPYDDELRPPLVWPASSGTPPRWRTRNIDLDALPSLPSPSFRPVPVIRDFASAGVAPFWVWDRASVDLVPYWRGSTMQASRHLANRGEDLAVQDDVALPLLLTAQTNREKLRWVVPYVQRGLDWYGVMLDAFDQGATVNQVWEADGGWNLARWDKIETTAHLLDDTTMKAAFAGNVAVQEKQVSRYVTQADVDYTQDVAWSGSTGFTPEYPYEQGMVDGQSLAFPMPEYFDGPDLDDGLASWQATPSYYRYANPRAWHLGAALLTSVAGTTPHAPYAPVTVRHWYMGFYGEDPWRFAGGTVARYDRIPDAPAVATPDLDDSSYKNRLLDSYLVGAIYDYPWSAPVVSAPVLAADGRNDLTFDLSTDTGTGKIHWAVTTSATSQSVADIVGGKGAAAFGTQAVTTTGSQTQIAIGDGGLDAGTTYYVYALHRDEFGSTSNVITDNATTDAPFAVPFNVVSRHNFGRTSDTGALSQSVDIGAATDREIYVIAASILKDGATDVAVTVGGQTATKVVDQASVDGVIHMTCVKVDTDPGGTSATVALAANGGGNFNVGRSAFMVLVTNKAGGATVQTSNSDVDGQTLSLDVNTSADQLVVAANFFLHNASASTTWAGATKNGVDIDIDTDDMFSVAVGEASAIETRTVSADAGVVPANGRHVGLAVVIG